MDEIAKSIERKFELGLSDEQSQNIDSLFQEFMRDYHFPKFQPVNDSLLRFQYFRKALNVLTKEQLDAYRIKKLEAKSKNIVRKKEKSDRQLNHLKVEYKDVSLTPVQLEIVQEIKNSFRKQLIELEERQSKILNSLESTIDKTQRNELDKLFTYQVKRNRRNKAESTKRKYKYLSLRDDQAKEISILDELEKKLQKENGYKGYDPYLINLDFKDILTKNQFELYSAHKQQQKEKSLKSQIDEDSRKSDDFIDLEAWKNFEIENILPVKCKIVKQLLNAANEEDLIQIEKLKKNYSDIIDETVLNRKITHTEKYGSELPNHLKLRLIETTLLDINPSPILLQEIDLNTNGFTSIELNEEQESELEALRLKKREYNIKRLEKKLKGSYASLTSVGRKRITPKYLELYSILLLDEEPYKNIEKMKMRQIIIDKK